MGRLVSLAGWSIFLFVAVGTAFQYGKRWEVGPQGFNTLVASDGEHYRDGTPIDQLTLALNKSGHEGSIQLAMLGVIGAGVAYVAWAAYRSSRQWANVRESCRRAGEQEQGNSPRG
jgi:hypothetical protein